LFNKDIPSKKQDSFLVETHSISGYSGSPVFVRPFPVRMFNPIGLPMPNDLRGNIAAIPSPPPLSPQRVTGPQWDSLPTGPWLLGVHWGCFPLDNDEVEDSTKGISCVVPAWELQKLLFGEEAMKQRKFEQEALAKRFQRSRVKPRAQSTESNESTITKDE
jgi:hypothetical protein